ncbi:hypothetical protein ACFQDF_17955 [Ectobacillus funiculus]|uniref:Uncharacterized protein n=1 Tax=Ectobacillus funiculus TaxID=137993 RepID=A0ABV5WF88_9BACI
MLQEKLLGCDFHQGSCFKASFKASFKIIKAEFVKGRESNGITTNKTRVGYGKERTTNEKH